MSGTDHNPPAFPVFPEPGVCSGTNGMTLRDYFAAQAMPALITHFTSQPFPAGETWEEGIIALQAYTIADAMLKEREQ